MRRQYLILMALLCAVPLRAHSQELDYFPLQPGNYWAFRAYDQRYSLILPTEQRFTISVIADTFIADEVYHRIVQQWTKTFMPDTIVARSVPPMLFWRLGETEEMVYCFSSPIGSYWSTHLQFRPWELLHPYKVQVTLPELVDMQATGSLVPGRSFIAFKFKSTVMADLEWDEVYALGIGPVFIRRYPDVAEIWDYLQIEEAFVSGQLVDLDSVPTAIQATSLGWIKQQAGTPGRTR